LNYFHQTDIKSIRTSCLVTRWLRKRFAQGQSPSAERESPSGFSMSSIYPGRLH